MKTFVVSKTKSWFLSITASMLVALVISCQKNDQVLTENTSVQGARLEAGINAVDAQIKGDYEVRAGTLHFRDSDAFLKTHKTLAKSTHDERLKFAQTAGFRSLLSFYDEFKQAIQAAEAGNNEAQFKKVLSQYADIVSLDKDQNLSFNVQNSLLASYLDRTGVVYIGKILYKFGDYDQTMVLDGDRAKLNSPESSIVKHFSQVAGTKAGARTASVCTGWRDRELRITSDRLSKLSVYAQVSIVQQANGQWQITYTPYAIGMPFKRTTFAGWQQYTTDNRMYVNWTFSAYSTEPGQPYSPGNQYSKRTETGPFNNRWDSIEFWDQVVTFSNLNNGSGGSVFYQFSFPPNNGWHEMLGARNPMSCP